MKKLVLMLVSLIVINAQANDGLFWSARTNGQGVLVYRGVTSTPGAAQCVGTPAQYLKMLDGAVVKMTDAEKAFVDLPAKYKKTVEGVLVEMTAEEKHLVDVPVMYKNPDGTEMTDEQKVAVDAAEETARQAAKPVMQKVLENMYVTFLTNQWTDVLRSASLITSNDVITVANTDASQNMQYLMYFRAAGVTNTYDYYSNEFGRFKTSLKDYYGADLTDCKWHADVVVSQGIIKGEIKLRMRKR